MHDDAVKSLNAKATMCDCCCIWPQIVRQMTQMVLQTLGKTDTPLLFMAAVLGVPSTNDDEDVRWRASEGRIHATAEAADDDAASASGLPDTLQPYICAAAPSSYKRAPPASGSLVSWR